MQVWLVLRRHVGVEKGDSAGDAREHGGVFERHEAKRRREAAIRCTACFRIWLVDIGHWVASGEASCVCVGAIAVDMRVYSIGWVARGV